MKLTRRKSAGLLTCTFLALAVAWSGPIASTHAGVILTEDQESNGIGWPETPTWTTYTPIASYAGTGITASSTNKVAQTYTPIVSTAGTIGKLFLRYNNTALSGDSYQLLIYKVSDTRSNPLVVGDLVHAVAFSLTLATTSTNPVLTIALSGGDQFTLTAGQGYAFEIVGTSTGSIGMYRRGGANYDGQGYVNDVPIASGSRDVLMGYSLAVVPEPATLAMLALGGLMMVKRRRIGRIA